MRKMKSKTIWIIFLIISITALAACGANTNKENDNQNNKENQSAPNNNNLENDSNNELNNNNTENTPTNEASNSPNDNDTPDIDTTTADGYDRMTFKNFMDDVAAEKVNLDDFESMIEDPAYLKYIPFETTETDISVIASAMSGNTEDTEDIEAFFEKHTDGKQFIRFELDDKPIRALNVPTENVPMTSILNFSPYVINAYSGKTIIVDEKEENYWITYITTMRTDETQNAAPSEFRTWDQLSNLEQTYLPIFGKTIELIYQLTVLEASGYMDSEAAQLIQDQFALIGDETMMFPEPQTNLDYVMYNNITELKPYWNYLATYKPDDPQYKETLDKVFTFTNDAGFQLNHILWSQHEDLLGAELYINAGSDF